MSDYKEGKLTINETGYEVYYKLFGKGSETVVGLHGGPGVDHRYLTRLGEIAGEGLQVLLYDQLGSGKSDRPDDKSLWTVPRFVEEVETVRNELGLGKIHLFGQSWGGMLGLQYALDHPEALKSLILSNTSASTAEMLAGMQKHRLELPRDVFWRLQKHEAAGDFDNPEMVKLVKEEYYSRFLRRSTPFDLKTSIKEYEEIVEPILELCEPYYYMWGPYEFICNGTLIDWDVTDRLHEISFPTLILAGWYDEVHVDGHFTIAKHIPDNEFVIFGNSSHITILEKEGDAYLAVIRNFIDRAVSSS